MIEVSFHKGHLCDSSTKIKACSIYIFEKINGDVLYWKYSGDREKNLISFKKFNFHIKWIVVSILGTKT